MIEVKNLHVSVEGKEILKGINLKLNSGEVVAVMGPNGSGKSTLAYSLAGHPKYEVIEGRVIVDGEDVTEASPDERANKGVFLGMQSPVAIPGLTVQTFLRQIYKNRNKEASGVVEFREWLSEQARLLDINPELLKRGLNDGFSGGERKKMEILQMLVFNPKYIILDEIDSGLDVDALKKIAKTVAKVAEERKIGVMVITHYSRILKYLKLDRVVVLESGVVVNEGGEKLVDEIEVEGFKK